MALNDKISSSKQSIIQASELLELYGAENLIVVDASNGNGAKENYAERHIDCALYVDLNTQLSSIKANAANGGRHPLPTVDEFVMVLQKLGISEESHVVIYDNNYGANAAARFWWMVKAVGHKKVQVLNGGLQQAEKLGLPINNAVVTPNQVGAYKATQWLLPMAEMAEVAKHSEDKDYAVIDVREPNRYRGEFEPIDLIAGHIPGALNVPLSTNLNDEGLFLSKGQLQEKYGNLFKQIKPENTIVHCGSGVTACHTLLAMDYAGLEIPKLYVGSWSEWSRNENPIAKGAE